MVQTFTEFGSIWKFSLDIVYCLLHTQMKENAALQNKQLVYSTVIINIVR